MLQAQPVGLVARLSCYYAPTVLTTREEHALESFLFRTFATLASNDKLAASQGVIQKRVWYRHVRTDRIELHIVPSPCAETIYI